VVLLQKLFFLVGGWLVVVGWCCSILEAENLQ